jgi:hypothetical protein
MKPYPIVVRTLALIVLIAVFALAGCSGVAVNANVGTIISNRAASAAVILPEAQAGTLSTADALAVMVNVGETFKTLHTQELGTNGWTYLVDGKNHGMLFIDPAYVPAFSELAANVLASENRSLGAWAVTPPTQAYANAQAAQSLRALLIVQGMVQDKTSQTVSLKRPVASRKVKAVPVDLSTIIKAIPGWQAAFNSLPANVQAQVNADLPIVISWTADQITAWWNLYLAGDTIGARVDVLNSLTDAQLQTTGQAAGNAAVAAIGVHVAGEVAFLNGLKDFALAVIPAILALLGL